MKRKRVSKKVPKKGDPEYLTPTQLRNRRKRRSKKQGSISANDVTSSKTRMVCDARDPSMKYINEPTNAPIVRAAKNFFRSVMQNSTNGKEFRVHVGPLDGWRTVSKLAVRGLSSKNDSEMKVAIGLFLPHSHKLLPVPNCRAHHPSINHAVGCIEKACHEVGVVPYRENDSLAGDSTRDFSKPGSCDTTHTKDNIEIGEGQLRYVAVNVARETGALQITLVWNTPPPPPRNCDKVNDPVLKKFVSKLLDMASVDTEKPTFDCGSDCTVAASTDATDTRLSDIPLKKKRRRGARHEEKFATKDCALELINQTVRPMTMRNLNRLSTDVSSEKEQLNHFKLNLHSLWINYNQSWKHSNAIFSHDATCWKHIYGPDSVVEHLNFDDNAQKINSDDLACPIPLQYPIPLHFPPNVFRQANLDFFTNIVGRIRERMQQLALNSNVACVELYGGVGTIGLYVSDLITSLDSSDENPNNSRCFYDSVRVLPTGIQPNLVYHQLNAADMVTTKTGLFERCHVLIVDPPRKGLDVEVVDYLCKEGWKSMQLVVYVSCGFLAFQRDCEMLIKSGKWKLEFAEGYLLFPGSDAIETLAFFIPIN